MSKLTSISFGSDDCISFENDSSKLAPDSEGYYTLIVGAANTFNTRGEYYTGHGVDELFSSRSNFIISIETNGLESENEHPAFSYGMSKADFIRRINVIDKSNVCALIKSVWLVKTTMREPGADANLILVYAKVKPYGEKAHVLASRIANGENIAFSVRSLTFNDLTSYPMKKTFKKIVTWDHVRKPGIRYADSNHTSSFASMSMESESSVSVDLMDDNDVKNVVSGLRGIVQQHREMNLGLEEDDANLEAIASILECASGGRCIAYKW